MKCPNCGSKNINTEYLSGLDIQEFHCESCGYSAHPISFEEEE